MLGLIFVFVAGVYLLMQLVFVPWLAYYMGRKGGLGRRGAVLCAVLGFLVFAAPVWHKELPAIIVYNVLKKDCDTFIHKPFEQWVQENPGVLETLERNDKLYEMKKEMGEQYPNRYIFHKGRQFRIMAELRSGGKQRIIWYVNWSAPMIKWAISQYKPQIIWHENWDAPITRVERRQDILYDMKRKEVLAEETKIVYGPPFGFEPLGPSWYYGRAKPGEGVDGYSVRKYYEFFVNKGRN